MTLQEQMEQAHESTRLDADAERALDIEISEIWKAVKEKKLSYREASRCVKEAYVEAYATKSQEDTDRGLI